MKSKIIFEDSIDDSEMTLSTCPENNNYVLAITSGSEIAVWFSPAEFVEFLNECNRFYTDNEKRKNELPQGEK